MIIVAKMGRSLVGDCAKGISVVRGPEESSCPRRLCYCPTVQTQDHCHLGQTFRTGGRDRQLGRKGRPLPFEKLDDVVVFFVKHAHDIASLESIQLGCCQALPSSYHLLEYPSYLALEGEADMLIEVEKGNACCGDGEKKQLIERLKG